MRRMDFLRMSGLLGMSGLFSSFAARSGNAEPESLDAAMKEKIKVAGLNGSAFHLKAAPIPKVRIALFGLGNRGQSLIDMLNWLVQEGHAEITAISDINPKKVQRAKEQIGTFQRVVPAVFTGAENAWEQAMSSEVADLALICTPWEWHTMYAMGMACQNGLKGHGKRTACGL